MSMSNLSIDGEFRYILQWFNESSEMQRDDFVPVLVEYLLAQKDDKNSGVYMNGVVNSVGNVDINDKPMSLFQCRIKLFRQWNTKWPAELKHKLQEKITEVDSKIGEKIVNEISAHKQIHSNGNGIIADDEHNGDNIRNEDDGGEEEIIPTAAAAAASITTDNQSSVIMLNNETIMRDDGDNDGGAIAVEAAEPAEQVQMQTQENVNAVVTVTQTTVSNNAEVPLVA